MDEQLMGFTSRQCSVSQITLFPDISNKDNVIFISEADNALRDLPLFPRGSKRPFRRPALEMCFEDWRKKLWQRFGSILKGIDGYLAVFCFIWPVRLGVESKV